VKSPRELANRALTLLGVVAAGQTASAEDYDPCIAGLRPLLAELIANEACNIAVHPTDDTRAEIPDEYFNALAALLANDAAPAFGIAQADEATRQGLIMRVRRVTAAPAFGYPQIVDYF
jgi:hypothetical protein